MKIVVRGTNWIGDAVMTIPAMRELRRIFPEAKISLHTRSWSEAIFRDSDFIDQIIPIEQSGGSLKTLYREARNWRLRKFDVAILFTNSFHTALLSKLGRVRKSYGFKNEARSFLLTNPVDMPKWKNEKHQVFYYLHLIGEVERDVHGTLTGANSVPRFDLTVSDQRRVEARQMLERIGVDLSKPTVALGVGSANSRAKRWPARNFSGLCDRLQDELNAEVILIGSKDELEISNEVEDRSKLKPKILTGKTNLTEAVAILAISDLLVSNDMGLAHVSSAVGTKTLTLFGPTNPITTRPWISEIIVRDDVDCSPCMLRDCPIDHRCMTRITPDFVFQKAADLLN